MTLRLYALRRHRITHHLAAPSGAVGRTVSMPRRSEDGGTLEYVFEASEQNAPDAVTKEKSRRDCCRLYDTTFYHLQVGALETQEFRTMLVPFWLICFSDTITGCTPAILPVQMERLLIARFLLVLAHNKTSEMPSMRHSRIRFTSLSVISSFVPSYSLVVRGDSCPAICWACSSCPSFSR
jgi:hypothetical protein